MKNLLILILALICKISYPQVSQEWVAKFNGTANSYDGSNLSKFDSEKNIYVSGFSNGEGTGMDFCILKYNPQGKLLWFRTYDVAKSTDDSYAMTVDREDNVYLTGISEVPDKGFGILTIKYSPDGELQWANRHENAAAHCICVDSQGNVYVTGCAFINEKNSAYLLLKYNADGVKEWEKIFVEGFYGEVFGLALDFANNIIITGGVREKEFSQNSTVLTLKYNSKGELLWERRYTGNNGIGNCGRLIKTDLFDNIYIAGQTTGENMNDDILTMKYNTSGDLLWSDIYNGSGNQSDFARALFVNVLEGDVYIAGTIYGGESNYDYGVIKYNSKGIKKWEAKYNNSENGADEAQSVCIDKEGNLYVTGLSYKKETSDWVTVKYDTSGVTQWVKNYHGPVQSSDCANSVNVDESGNVFVAGFSGGENSQTDIVLIKYSQKKSPEIEIPKNYSLSQNYPNPFNPVTSIEFSIPESTFVTLTVYDVLGRESELVVNEILSPGNYRKKFDGSQYANGTYFYKLQTEKFSETKKMILLK